MEAGSEHDVVAAALRWVGRGASARLLERDPSWIAHMKLVLQGDRQHLTDEQKRAIWPEWEDA